MNTIPVLRKRADALRALHKAAGARAILMKPPIIVLNSGDITLHESAEAACSVYEPRDITHGYLVFYESEGHLLQATISDVSRGWLWLKTVKIGLELKSVEPINRLELRVSIIQFFVLHPEYGWASENIFSLNLDELISTLLEKVGYHATPQ